jgi:hypothetical protein
MDKKKQAFDKLPSSLFILLAFIVAHDQMPQLTLFLQLFKTFI